MMGRGLQAPGDSQWSDRVYMCSGFKLARKSRLYQVSTGSGSVFSYSIKLPLRPDFRSQTLQDFGEGEDNAVMVIRRSSHLSTLGNGTSWELSRA